jgi:hypothetical protein
MDKIMYEFQIIFILINIINELSGTLNSFNNFSHDVFLK